MTEKVAVSLDAELLARVERLRRATGETRSAVFARALRQLVDAEAHARKVSEYVEGYRRIPETANEIESARSQTRRSLEGLAWDDS